MTSNASSKVKDAPVSTLLIFILIIQGQLNDLYIIGTTCHMDICKYMWAKILIHLMTLISKCYKNKHILLKWQDLLVSLEKLA